MWFGYIIKYISFAKSHEKEIYTLGRAEMFEL